MNGESCASCRFFVKGRGADGSGVCRRYPPSVMVLGLQPNPLNPRDLGEPIYTAAFPGMAASGWCGEWASSVRASS